MEGRICSVWGMVFPEQPDVVALMSSLADLASFCEDSDLHDLYNEQQLPKKLAERLYDIVVNCYFNLGGEGGNLFEGSLREVELSVLKGIGRKCLGFIKVVFTFRLRSVSFFTMPCIKSPISASIPSLLRLSFTTHLTNPIHFLEQSRCQYGACCCSS